MIIEVTDKRGMVCYCSKLVNGGNRYVFELMAIKHPFDKFDMVKYLYFNDDIIYKFFSLNRDFQIYVAVGEYVLLYKITNEIRVISKYEFELNYSFNKIRDPADE